MRRGTMDNQFESLVPKRIVDPSGEERKRGFVIYCRVSTDEQVRAGNSLEAQEREAREYAERESRPVHGVERDEGLSAYSDTLKRPGLMRAIDLAERTGSDILVRELSRFCRDVDMAILLTARLRQRGIYIESVTEPSDHSSLAGRGMELLRFLFNEMESESTATRTLSTMYQNFRRRDPESGWGLKNGGQPPFGYKSHRVDLGRDDKGKHRFGYIYLRDDTLHQGKPIWEWLRHALVEMRLERGASYKDIAEFFNSIGLSPPRKKDQPWNHSTIQEICRWDRLIEYAGVGLFNRTAQKKTTRRKVGRRERPWSDVIVMERGQEPIITVDEAKALNELTKSRQVRRGHTNRVVRSAYLLTGGLSTCAKCGEGIVGHGSPAGRRYVCGMYKRTRGAGCPSNRSIRCELADEPLLEYLHRRYAAPKARAQLQKAVDAEYRKASGVRSSRRRELERGLRDIEGQIRRLVDAMAKGGKRLRSVTARIEHLEAEQDQLSHELEREGQKRAPKPPDVEALLSRFKERFRDAAPDARKRMIKAFIKQVEFDLEANEIRVHQYQRPELEALASSTQSQNWIQDGSGGLLRRYS
jgi:site-specific DNA recombinase